MDLAGFRRTLKDDILTGTDYVDAAGVAARLKVLEPAIDSLVASLASGEAPTLLRPIDSELAELLIAQRAEPSTLAARIYELFPLLSSLDVRSLVAGLLIARGRTSVTARRRARFDELVRAGLNGAIQVDSALTLRSRTAVAGVPFTFEYAIQKDGRTVVAIVSRFQSYSGGRLYREFEALIELQTQLALREIVLLIVAEGPGFRKLPERLADRLHHVTNLTGIQEGAVASALRESEQDRPRETSGAQPGFASLSLRAQGLLRSEGSVTRASLGLTGPRWSELVERLRIENPDFDVVGDSEMLRAARFEEIARARKGEIRGLGQAIAGHLGLEAEPIDRSDGLTTYRIYFPEADSSLPNPLLLFEVESQPPDGLESLLLRSGKPERIGVAITRSTSAIPLQQQRYGRVATLDLNAVVELLLERASPALRQFMDMIVQRIDLRAISPFISEGPAPAGMFFGREPEVRRIREQVGTASFALVGGRKAGKTSILRALERLLPAQMPVLYIDCQAHSTRSDFLLHLQNETRSPVILPAADHSNTEAIVRAALHAAFKDQRGVVLLDEVDSLFGDDARSDENPHLLSAALRSMSQRGIASFVATGERVLYGLTTDASSPHWNFCVPMVIGALERSAAERLLTEPLGRLGISLSTNALEEAIRVTGAHANLIQQLGTRIIDTLSEMDRSRSSVTVEVDTIRAIASTASFRQTVITTYWSQATDLEKLASLRLNPEVPKQADRLQAEIEELASVSLDPRQVERAMRYLQLYQLAAEDPLGYRLSTPSLDDFLAPLRGSRMERSWAESLR